MTAISGTLTDNTPLASFTPTNSVSDVVVTNRENQAVLLEAMAPNTGWELVASQGGAFPVSTPDTALLYRFRGLGNDVDFDYYMGP